MKQYVVCLEKDGFQELDMAMVGTPVNQLVDLVSAEVHEVSQLAPPSPVLTPQL